MRKIVVHDYFNSQGFFLTQSYGVNSAYYSQFNLLFHEGVDFGHNNKEIVVKSPLSGVVIFDDDDGRGNYGVNVKIWDDVQLCAIQYGHFDGNMVTHGQRIKVGDDIGEMGNTGNSEGEHIHFNFLLTDSSGNRLYNTKPQNWGFLDPQHPLDPTAVKKLPGVEDYFVEWRTPGIITPPSNMNDKLAHFFNLMWHATQGENVDTNKVTEDQVKARIIEMVSEKLRGGQWDALAKLTGYTGDTGKLTSQSMYDRVNSSLKKEIERLITEESARHQIRKELIVKLHEVS